MLILYLIGLLPIVLTVSIILKEPAFYLEKKNYYFLLGCSLFGMYFYLSSFLIIYLHNIPIVI